MMSAMPKRLPLAVSLLLSACLSSATPAARNAPTTQPGELTLPGLQRDGSVLLPSGWSLRPAGRQVQLGHFPVNLAVHPSGKWVVALHAGMTDHEAVVIETATRKVVSRVVMDQCFYGLCFSPDGARLYASGAEFEVIHAFKFADGWLSDDKPIRVADEKQTFLPGGVATSADGRTLYAAGTFGHEVAVVPLDEAGLGAGEAKRFGTGALTFPYAILPDPQNPGRLFVSLWGKSGVAVIDPAAGKVTATWATEPHPTEMALSPDGSTLYVACANSTRVSVLDTKTGEALETILCALHPKAPPGNTPTSLTLSPDGKTLYVANANANNLAVIDVSERGKAKPRGFVPTGWYPTCVRFNKADNRLYVLNGKGGSSLANPLGPQPGAPVADASITQYIGRLFKGTMSVIDVPTDARLARFTKTAYEASPLRDDLAPRTAPPAGSPIPGKVGDPSPIKYVIYVIKENRTYDQVFGDVARGNGDPKLCLFPQPVTPNHHKLVDEFVLLDNFYVESEVSAQGHEWSMGAIASDFVEKVWQQTYRGSPKDKLTYPAEGDNPNYRGIAPPANGYLWDRAKKAGVSYYSFGEWVDNAEQPDQPGTAKSPTLEGHFDPLFRSFDMNYPDQKRADRFIAKLKEFDQAGDMPRLIILRLPNDHTAGTKVGVPTPRAYLADNDLALGRVVEAVSNSKFWPQTAMFVVEDDAQNGPDHVDAHRTVAMVISPWTRRGGHVDSSMYSTAGMLRTMELILGLEPMTAFDAAAAPMYGTFAEKPDLTPYKHVVPSVDLNEKNTAAAWGAGESAKMAMAKEDAADDLLLNEVIWRSVKGIDSKMPAPVRAAFVRPVVAHDDDDD
jgi:YVTN family beta-propeller protein